MVNIIEQSNGVKTISINTPYEGMTASINALTQTVSGKADKTDLNGKANQSDLDTTNAQLASVMQQVVNIMNPPIPMVAAKGDGVTDDTQAIQNIINSLTNGGTVLFPSKKFMTGKLTLKNYINLMGVSGVAYTSTAIGGSVLSLNNTTDTSLIDTTGASGCSIINLVLNGNTNGGTANGINILGRSILVENCKIVNFKGSGIYGANTGTNRILNNFIGWNMGSGIYMGSGFADTMIRGNYINANTGDGINLQPGSNTNYINNNRIEWNAGHGLSASSVNEITLTDNQFDRNGAEGIRLVSCIKWIIKNNLLKRNSSTVTSGSESANLYLQSCSNYVFEGNTFGVGQNDDSTGNITPYYAITYYSCVDANMSGNLIKASTLDAAYPKWVTSTPYTSNTNIQPPTYNSCYYTCTTAGTSGSTSPTWPTTEGATVTDGTVIWTAHKVHEVNQWSNTNINWANNITS